LAVLHGEKKWRCARAPHTATVRARSAVPVRTNFLHFMSKRKQAPTTDDDSPAKRHNGAEFLPLIDAKSALIQGWSETPSLTECWETIGELFLSLPTEVERYSLVRSLIGCSDNGELRLKLFNFIPIVQKLQRYPASQPEVFVPRLVRIVDSALATSWEGKSFSEQHESLKELGELIAGLKLGKPVRGKRIAAMAERATLCTEVAHFFGNQRHNQVETILQLYCSAR
jgi:hypothetical protein